MRAGAVVMRRQQMEQRGAPIVMNAERCGQQRLKSDRAERGLRESLALGVGALADRGSTR